MYLCRSLKSVWKNIDDGIDCYLHQNSQHTLRQISAIVYYLQSIYHYMHGGKYTL